MKKGMFIRAVEKNRHGRSDIYDGIIICMEPKEVKMIAQGPESESPIREVTLEIKEFEFKNVSKESVLSIFEKTLVESQRKFLMLELDNSIGGTILEETKRFA